MKKKNFLKRFVLLLFSLTVSISAVGCGGNDSSVDVDPIEEVEFYETLDDTAELVLSGTYSFESDLSETYSLYPESTGRTFYVSSSQGSDSNDGLSENKPLKSLTAVQSINLEPGDKVLFQRGNVFSGGLTITENGEDDNPIVLGAYGEGSDRPLLTNRGTVIQFSDVSNLVIRDLEIAVSGEPLTNASRGRMAIHGRYNTTANKTYAHKNIYIVNNRCYSGDYNSDTYGIFIQGYHDNNNFSTCPSNVLSNAYVLDNEVFNVGQLGIASTMNINGVSHNGCKRDYFKDFHFENNDVYNVGFIGMFLGCVKDGTLNRNEVSFTGLSETGVKSYGDCGLMAISSENLDIMYNITYENKISAYTWDAMGIDIDWNTKNINVQYNYCYSSDGSGIGTMACTDSYIRNNKIVDNRCNSSTPQLSQIEVGDFTVYYEGIEDEFYTVSNLEISNNLIIYTNPQDGKSFFSTRDSNGKPDWKGNTFEKNHCVLPNDNPSNDFNWIQIDEDRAWNKIANNMYFGVSDTFNVIDQTVIADMLIGNAYDGSNTFSAWQQRDVGSIYSSPDYTRPKALSGVNAEYTDGKIILNWIEDSSIWHYNLYLVKENEQISYRNLLSECFEGTYEFSAQSKGSYYFVVEPESHCGAVGQQIKIKVELA